MARRTRPRLKMPKHFLPMTTFAVGFAVMVLGIAQIYGPAGWIVAGLGLMAAVAAAPIW